LISEIPDNCDQIFKIPEGNICFVYISGWLLDVF
jgi:hypothetical protein